MTDPIQIPAAGAALAVSEQALDLVRDELLALDPGALAPMNVDVAAAALLVIGAASEIRTYRSVLVQRLGEEAAKSVDRLELLAQAALRAHAIYRAVESGADVLPLSAEVDEIRDVLRSEARTLIIRKAISSGSLAELSGKHGYKNLCVDVLQLVSAMKRNWATVGPRTGLTMAYLDRADGLANELARAVAVREQGAKSADADLRRRAFTLLAQTYDDVRAMITFIRWKQGDADRIAPSLFRGRPGRRRSAQASTELPAQPSGEQTHVVAAPGMPGAPPFVDA